jgi:DNA end-binding protein Ku
MAARAIATGTISFGLVSIPIKVYSASQPQATVSFHLLHKKDGSRLKQQYLCAKDGEKVDREDMVKGYEFAKGQYVIFTPEELEALEERATQAIEITEFVPADKVDPVYFDKPYYLGPDKGGDRPYRLLAEAMTQTGRSALAKYAARGKQYLVLVRAANGGLVMQQLHYADEVKAFTEIPVGEATVKPAELQLAVQLVEQAATDEFHPEKYEDEYQKRLQDIIQKKIEGQEVSLAPVEEPKAQIIDLMEALKASLASKAKPAEEPAGHAETKAEEGRRPAKRAARHGHAAKGKASKE